MWWSLLSLAYAGLPLAPFPDCDQDHPESCPSDLDDWWQIGWIPPGSLDSVRPAEKAIGPGIALDRALRHTAGRFDVTIAILDSGVMWDAGQLMPKIRLNAEELPVPQNPEGADYPSHDANGDGIFNIWDYGEDPRIDKTIGRDRADDRLDPSDLIYTFSDGVDDDGNGYADDIAGWDFFQDDNDPFPDFLGMYADHGTGVMNTAAELGNDGGSLGTCPNCSVLPIRVGDTFVTTGGNIGQGIAFAADSGAVVIGMALGGMTQPEFTRQAIEYASTKAVVIGVAGDENSYHHNFPAAADPILYVHGVRGNNRKEEDGTYSYLNFLNCNNFGPRVDIVAPNEACGTGSTATLAGVAGMVWSAARDQGLDLHPEAIKSLLRSTVDDVALTQAESDQAKTYPSLPGRDAFYGRGRASAGNAVEWVVEGKLPPIARLRSPGWFTRLRPDAGPVEVKGWVEDPDGGAVSWKLLAGAGPQPTDWVELASGTGPMDGVLASVAVGDLPRLDDSPFLDLDEEDVVERTLRAHRPQVQLRLEVTDDEGLIADDQHGIDVWADPDDAAGFPKFLGTSIEAAPNLADLDGDGIFEIVVGDSSGRVHAWKGDGTELPGFPVTTDDMRRGLGGFEDRESADHISSTLDGFLAAVAVGDLDGDGKPELVGATLQGRVYAWTAGGERVPGFPVTIIGRTPEEFIEKRTWENGILGSPTLFDVDDDGKDEILVGAMDQRLYVWRGDGTDFPGYPLELCDPLLCGVSGSRIISTPAVGDIDGDGDPDLAIGSNEVPKGAAGALHLVDLRSATPFANSPIPRKGLVNTALLPLIGEGHPTGAALADLDGDGDLEIFAPAMLALGGPIHHDGTDALDLSYAIDRAGELSNFDDGSVVPTINSPSFGDLDGDGTPEALIGGVGVSWPVSLALTTKMEYQHGVIAWNGKTGATMPGFPRQVDDTSFLVNPTVAEISGDGDPEVLFGTGGFFTYAWDQNGKITEGWPKYTGGWQIAGPSVGDVDGDGYVEVVTATREGFLFVWHTKGSAAVQTEWPQARHDSAHTGNYELPLPVQEGPVLVDDDPKGCCQGKSGGADAAGIALLTLPWLLRRRRQR